MTIRGVASRKRIRIAESSDVRKVLQRRVQNRNSQVENRDLFTDTIKYLNIPPLKGAGGCI